MFTSVVVLASRFARPPHNAMKSFERKDSLRPNFGNGTELAFVVDIDGDIVAAFSAELRGGEGGIDESPSNIWHTSMAIFYPLVKYYSK